MDDDSLIRGGDADNLQCRSAADYYVDVATASGVDALVDINEIDRGTEGGNLLEFCDLKVAAFIYLVTRAFTGVSENSDARINANEVLVDSKGDETTNLMIMLKNPNSVSQLLSNELLWT